MERSGNSRANFVWNMIGSVFESVLSFVLLIVVNRTVGEAGGGVFTLAFSHAQLMYYLGTLEVRTSNESARRFYRRNGFMETDILRGFYRDGGDGVRMVAPVQINQLSGKLLLF